MVPAATAMNRPGMAKDEPILDGISAKLACAESRKVRASATNGSQPWLVSRATRPN